MYRTLCQFNSFLNENGGSGEMVILDLGTKVGL